MKNYKGSKRKIKAQCILLFLILLPLIFNSYLFNFFKIEINKNIDDFGKNSKDFYPNTSSNHPINAGDFKYYKNITIDHTKVSGTGNLIDFPVLVSIFDSDLHDEVQPDGDDIAFANNFQWLDHEIELFNQNYNATHAYLVAWVRIPVLSPSEDTIIRMYYRNSLMDSRENPSGVWNSNYEAVWHMNNNPLSSNILDSTSNNNDLATTGFTSDARFYDGKLGPAISVDGINDRFEINSINGPINDFTFQTWFKFDNPFSGGGSDMYFFQGNSPTNNYPLMRFSSSSGVVVTEIEVTSDPDESCTGNKNSWAADTWFQFAYTRSMSAVRAYHYINGSQDAEDNSADNANPHISWDRLSILGSLSGSNMWGPGAISEFRILNITLSPDWIATEFNNQFNPSSFYKISDVQVVYVPSILDFQYFKEIIIDHNQVFGTNNLVNFPVLISIFDSDLHDNTQPDGDDIAFNNGTAWLFHEIELFNQAYNSTHAQLIAWVNIPRLNPLIDTVIRMYYGNATMESQENPQGVWDQNFIGIYHMDANPTGIITDSTNKVNLVGNNMDVSDLVNGQIGEGFNFDSSGSEYLTSTMTATIRTFTFSLWANPELHTWWEVLMNFDTEGSNFRYFAISDADTLGYDGEGGLSYFGSGVTQNQWQFFCLTYDGSQMKAYRNGNQIGSSISKTIQQRTDDFEIGSYHKGIELYDGKMDEVRISSVARSRNWIRTEYNNQLNPELFYFLSNEIRVEDDKPQDDHYFNFYKIIKVDHQMVFGLGYHLNFPLLLTMFDSDLHSDVQSDGDDIAFSLGSMWLDHEIEIFNQTYNGTHAELTVWVRIPQLSTSLDTYIRMYYGNSTMISRQNPTGVWDTSYKGVWHLSESSGITEDSTLYDENGIVSGIIIRPSMGQIGNAYDYGTDGTFNVGDPPDGHLDFGTQSFMVSLWINIDRSTSTWQIPLYKGATSTWNPGYCFGTPTTGDSLSFHITDGIDNIGSPYASISFDSWSYIIGIVDRTNNLIRIYKDGYEVDSGTDISSITSIDGDIEFQCANPTYDFDGLLDEVRVLNITRSNAWIKTEYFNQYDPSSFYLIGVEQSRTGILYSNLQVNSLDLFGNSIPYVNISLYNQTKLINNKLADSNGTALFTNLFQGQYNFTATIASDIGNQIEVVNITSEAILINQSFQVVDLICNVSSNFFKVIDIDGVNVDSGWIIVGNSTHELQNCSIDSSGQARFWWVNTSPYQYNYTVYYQDDHYYPSIIKVASGDINIVNSSIQIQAGLTTVDLVILTYPIKQPVSGVKLLLGATNPVRNIVNLTTDNEGKATLRWLNSTGINGNYSLQLEFFGTLWDFNMTGIFQYKPDEANFTVSSHEEFSIYIIISLENYQTKLLSLNPTEYISVEWGTLLKLRMLFNVSKAVGVEELLGPTYCDIMTYKIFKGVDLILSGNLGAEEYYTGVHYSLIDTAQLESDITYLLFISAQKSGYSLPSDLLLQLNVLENTLILNQSQNDDSIQSVYWSDTIDFSVKSYGEIYESFTIETDIFQNTDHSFRFSLPSINTNWNLTQITFNIYNISWNVNVSDDISLSILDPFGTDRIFNISNHAGWDYNLGLWTGLTINLNKESPTDDNAFEFFISGTFNGTIDVISEASFIRNGINAQYVKFNVSNTISLLSESEGWAIKNITFIIQNCYNTTTWEKVDLSPLTNLNISTIDGFKYSLSSGDDNGSGILNIDDKILYPLDNQYLFVVESNPNVIFDVIINVEYVQNFYHNQYLETLNITNIQKSIPNGGTYQLNLNDNSWKEKYAVLLVNGINNKIKYFSPSEVAMNITIEGQTYIIHDTLPGQGLFSLNGFNKDSLYTAIIETNQLVNFTLSFRISYSRTVFYETFGTITYTIREFPDIYGTVGYYPGLGSYLQTIDTSLIDAGHYTLIFELKKENYLTTLKDLNFIVMNRLTLINGESKIFRDLQFIYVKDSLNFTFLYTDALTGERITDLTTEYYRWEKYDINGNVTATGEASLIQLYDGSYILDFNSEIREVGDYLIIVTLDKDNYDYKNAFILLTIKTRFFEYSLSNNFKNFQTSIVKGKIVQIRINLTDPTQGGIPLLNSTIILTINDINYIFEEYGNGTYVLNFDTVNINAFFSSTTLTGFINISKENYFSEAFSIIIVVEMEQIFPGMPTFYFLIILFAIIAIVGSIIGYRVYKHAIIPQFVKNVREMKKEIKHGKSVSKSLLYQAKDISVGEIVRDKWSSIGISLGDIIGIEIKKSKKLPISKRIKEEKDHDLKPLGLLLMKWDERIGTELLAKYPENLNVTEKTLMQIYGTHEYTGEKGVINLTHGTLNIISYYTGPESGYYLILFLSLEDDPDIYEGAMPNIARIIMQNLEKDGYINIIPSLFQRLSVYPSLNNEQKLIYYYQDDIKRLIINLLRDYGIITKSELTIWIRDKELETIIDLEAILADLIKSELIKVASVKGIPSELIFLTKDIFMLRVPSDKLFKDPVNHGLPVQFVEEYQNEVQKFFKEYHPTEEDNVKLLDILVDPEVYETLRLLRTAIVTMKDFEKLKSKGVSDIYTVLKKLWDTNLIKVFKGEDNIEYYTLLTDFYIDIIFPKYVLTVVNRLYDEKSKADKVLIEYLNLLEETFINIKSKI